ncbi:MAG: lamin tail domain-containing protein [Bryobacteraceae bacterium]|nr:lamin tail domain-containing protein [Bryobacteraceae bacterium]
MRLAALLFTFTGLLAAQGSSDIVISQVYGGGGNAGAQLRSDFIELFNRGRATVNITGWSVQYTSATGTTWQVTPLTGSIAPGRYYLVKQADGANAAATALPTPDATGTIAMSGTAAKVALLRDTTIIDLVGYGETNQFEGSGPTRVLSNTTAAIRRASGCTDTDDNANDFQIGAPAPRSSATEPAVDCTASTPISNATISQIQGSGATSPLTGQLVITRGIITALGGNGLWIQSMPTDDDQNAATSEGLFIFTSTLPAATLARGHQIQATGTVTEFRSASDPGGPTLTELVDPVIEVQAQGLPLPAAIRLTSGTDWERYEGMRVSVPELRTVSGTLGSINESTATSTSNGVFFGVLPGAASPYRSPSPDETWELLRVDSRAQGGTVLDVTANTVVSDLFGPLDFAFRTYTIVQDPTPLRTEGGLTPAPIQVPPAGTFTIASANLRRLFDEQDDPGTSDPVVTTAAVQARLASISRVLRETLHSPDIIAVEEVENEPLLRRLAQATGDYEAYLLEGNDIGGIDVGLLIKRSTRTRIISVTQEGKETGTANDRLWDRPPLVARLEVGGVPFTAIVVHLRSLINADTATVAAKRRAQAEGLRDLITTRANLGEEVIVLGDFNMFQFDTLMINTIRAGEPVTNLTDTLPVSDNYSYIQDGVMQTLDHVLITEGLKARLYRYEVARVNTPFPEVARISDHDIPVATFLVDPGSAQLKPAGVTNAANYLTTSLYPGMIVTIFTRGLFGQGIRINAGDTASQFNSTNEQISFSVPERLSGTEATLRIGNSNTLTLPLRPPAPGIYVIWNQDGRRNAPDVPAAPGSIIRIAANGSVGETTVRIGGQPAENISRSQGSAAYRSISVRVPATLPPGNAPIVLSDGPRTGELSRFITIQ